MKFIILLLSMLTFVFASDFQSKRVLTLSVKDIENFSIHSRSGKLFIEGDASLEKIQVKALISIKGLSASRAKKFLKDHVNLRLEKVGNKAKLVAKIENNFSGIFSGLTSARIDLEIRIPHNLNLDINDGSGGIVILNTKGKLKIEDGSGSIRISNNRGDVYIEDGSGSLEAEKIKGNVEIEDGSGSITLGNIAGDVQINDGSGEMSVKKVTGKVVVWDGSGAIKIRDIDGDVIIKEDGSGGVSIRGVSGNVIRKD